MKPTLTTIVLVRRRIIKEKDTEWTWHIKYWQAKGDTLIS